MKHLVWLVASAVFAGNADVQTRPVSIPQAARLPRPSNVSEGGTFAIRLATDRHTYELNQPINVTFVLQNTAGRASSVIVRRAAHLDLRLSIHSAGSKVRENLPFRPEAGSARGVALAPGGTFTETEPLSKWLFALPPGEYDLTGEFYYAVNGLTLKTNAVRITVTP